jgi:positive regulator of sigma E activity
LNDSQIHRSRCGEDERGKAMKKTTGTVKRIDNNHYAWVLTQREGACAECHPHHGCCAMTGDGNKILVKARNELDTRPGDRVQLQFNAGSRLKWMLVLYIIPVFGTLAGALTGAFIWHTDGAAAAAAIAGLIFGFWIVRALATRPGSLQALTPEIVAVQRNQKTEMPPTARGCCA